MRVHIGPPPCSPDFDPVHEGWIQLREPTPIMLQFIAAPIAVALSIVLYLGWSKLTPIAVSNDGLASRTPITETDAGPAHDFVGPSQAVLCIVGGFFLLILVHELLHAFSMPDWGLTPQTLIGVWPSRMLFYAAHLSQLSKVRFIIVFMTPLIVLTIVPLLTCVALQAGNTVVATVSVVNGACACGDLVGAAMVAWQVPRTAQVRNQGWQTWWRNV